MRLVTPVQDELQDLYRFLQPKLVIPVHGEPPHMAANGRIARHLGVGAVLTGTNGDLFYLSPTPGVRRRWVSTGRLRWLEDEVRLESKRRLIRYGKHNNLFRLYSTGTQVLPS
jgi:hypothetical protein